MNSDSGKVSTKTQLVPRPSLSQLYLDLASDYYVLKDLFKTCTLTWETMSQPACFHGYIF